MIRRAVAVRYDRPADSGRTRPLRVAVELADGAEHDVFLKPSAAPNLDIGGLASEALVACIGGHLGMPLCQPLLVEILPEWIASIQDAGVRDVLTRSSPIAFGSIVAGDGWRPWLPSDGITNPRRDAARAILAFDALLANFDRRPSNPNLLIKNNDFRIIDHEMALRVGLLIPRSRPWAVGGSAWLTQPDGHVFAAGLKGTKALDLAPISHAWSDLTDEVLADCEAALPEQWATAANSVTDALTHLRAVRDSIGDCLAEIERVLE